MTRSVRTFRVPPGKQQANREPDLLGGAAPKRGLFSFLRG